MWIQMPNVLSDEQATILRNWGVSAPDPIPGLREEQGKFVRVDAPTGWKVIDHPHWCYRVLVDARGFWRATFFDKSKIHDCRCRVQTCERAVHTALFQRYDLPNEVVDGDVAELWEPRIVLGHCWVLWAGVPTSFSRADAESFRMRRALYPDADQPDRYWDLAIPAGALAHTVQV